MFILIEDFISYRGVTYAIVTGIILTQFKLIKGQKDIIDRHERNTTKLENLLKNLKEQDISQESKRLIDETLQKLE